MASRSIFNDIIVNGLHIQRKNGNYCDIRLSVGKDHIWTHSSVMCSLSPFISTECCSDKPTSVGNYKNFSLNSPLTIKLYRKNIFDCFQCLQSLMDILYGQNIKFNPIHSTHMYALCKLLKLSDVLIKFIYNQIQFKEIEKNFNIEKNIETAQLQNSIYTEENLTSSEDEDSLDEEQLPCESGIAKDSKYSERKLEKRKKFLNIRTHFVVSDFKTLSGKMQSCVGCSYKCYKPSDLLKHLRENDHCGNVCSLCLSKFDTSEELQEHYSLHDNPKPFFCTFCDSRFQTRGLLSQHLPRHSKETPYRCSLCKKGFKWKHGLNSHLMIHSNEKKYLCDECGFSAVHAKTMRAHKLTHSGNLFRCSFPGCQHTCSRKENMKIHLFTHSNDKPFVCEMCGLKFTLNKSLKRHSLIHTSVGLENSCPHCPFKALRADNLKAHILRQHNEKQINMELEENFGETLIDNNCIVSNMIEQDIQIPSSNCVVIASIGNDLSVLADAASSCSKIQNAIDIT